MKFGSTYFIFTTAKCDHNPKNRGANDVQLATDLNNKTVGIMRGTFTAEDLRKIADCLDGTKNITNEFEILSIKKV